MQHKASSSSSSARPFGAALPPGFRYAALSGVSVDGAARGGEERHAFKTFPPSVARQSVPPAVGSQCLTSRLVVTAPCAAADVLWEESVVAAMEIEPIITACPAGATPVPPQPRFPACTSTAATDFVNKAAMLWKAMRQQRTAANAAYSNGSSNNSGKTANARSVLDDDAAILSGGNALGSWASKGGSGRGDTAPGSRAAEIVECRLFAALAAQCAFALEHPHDASWARQLHLGLRDIFASESAARKSVEASVLLHKIADSVLAAGGGGGSKRTFVDVADLAVIHALVGGPTGDAESSTVLELYAGGPLCLARFAGSVTFVPFVSAANARLELCTDGDDAASGELRLRCVALQPLQVGDEVRVARKPLLTEAEAAAVVAEQRRGAGSAKGRGAPAALPGETAAEAARRKLLNFVAAAKAKGGDPMAAMKGLADAAARGGSAASTPATAA